MIALRTHIDVDAGDAGDVPRPIPHAIVTVSHLGEQLLRWRASVIITNQYDAGELITHRNFCRRTRRAAIREAMRFIESHQREQRR